MNKAFFTASLIATVLLASCQKEQSASNQRTNTDSSASGKLHKEVYTLIPENFESLIVEYFYDAEGRLARRVNTFKIREANGSTTVKEEIRKYFRDDEGRLIRIGELTDSIYVLVEYQPGGSRVLRIKDNLDRGYTEFEYNSSGKIHRLNFYQRYPNPTDPYKLTSYHTHGFDSNGNLTEKIYHQDDDSNGTYETPLKIFFTYDDKLNPLFPVDEALFPINWSLNSPNNTLSQINEYTWIVATKDTINYVYTYDNQQRPVTSRKSNEMEGKYFYY